VKSVLHDDEHLNQSTIYIRSGPSRDYRQGDVVWFDNMAMHCDLDDVANTICARTNFSVPTSGGRSPRSRFPGTMQRVFNMVSSTLTSAIRRYLAHLRFNRSMTTLALRFEALKERRSRLATMVVEFVDRLAIYFGGCSSIPRHG
jgi:hypothetical protein